MEEGKVGISSVIKLSLLANRGGPGGPQLHAVGLDK